jgi:very-short-patch-repair endonuclease
VIRLDVVWWDAGLGVELDSRKAHTTAHAFEADRRRDRRLAAQFGLQVVRVTWRQLHDEPDAIEADLKALLARGEHGRVAS